MEVKKISTYILYINTNSQGLFTLFVISMKYNKKGEDRANDSSHGSKKRSASTTPRTNKEQKETEINPGNKKKGKKYVDRTAYTQETDENGVFPSLLGFAPELQMLWWEYDMDTVIHNYIDDTKFTVCEYMEGKVDAFGIPIIKKEEETGEGADLK